MSKVQTETTLICKSDVCSLWTVMTDTERMNRAVGMSRVELTPLEGHNGAARYLATTRLGGFTVSYEERPYEWSYLKYYRIYRVMRNGPVRDLEMHYEFSSTADGGTEVRIRLTLEPRLGLLAPIVRFNSKKSLRRFSEEIRRLDAELVTNGRVQLEAARSAVAADVFERAAATLRRTSGVDAALADKLLDHVSSGADFDLSRVRPYELAAAWGAQRRDVLSTCLHAVKAGVLELRWDLVCPSCRVSTESVTSLSELAGHGACQLCDIQFGLELDEAVEATFTPAPAIRSVDQGPYCIGGPARTPHVLSQLVLPGNGAITRLPVPDEPGAYRLFVRGGKSLRVDVQPGASPELALVDAEGANGAWPQRAEVMPGGTIAIQRAEPGDRHVKLERMAWTNAGATAREVTALPVFRREFSADVLRPNVTLKVSRVALLFSDLTASTRLYARAGDAAAFRLVQDHFDVVLGLIDRHGGTLVKTIGDAVMAAFADELECFLASRAILEAFVGFRAQEPLRQETDIKLGMYAGPCYVVTANGILDYFGQTVNIAARLQAQAESAELVVEERLADEAIARGLVTREQVTERYAATLKGLDAPVPVARVRLTPA